MTYQQPSHQPIQPYPPVSGPPGAYPPLPAGPGQYPPATPQQVRPPLTSGLATASLVLGIFGALGGWCLFGLPCVLAVILGHLALRETRDGTRSGHGMAVAGLVLGYVFVGPMIAFTVMAFFGSVIGAATPNP
ncbi:DUF4190 domain-containing protein [Micromonospora sp. H33]|uniref:DUF4190 domain-containing protein n=1 Tax=Micromonospora sp. H33 TaxID=3452215 RepID=UPI003F8878BF